MKPTRTNVRRTGSQKSPRHRSHSDPTDAIDHAVVLIDTVCLIAGSQDLIGDHNDEPTRRLRAAIASHDTALLFGWLMEALSFQGISNGVAAGYMERHGRVTWRDIERSMGNQVDCPKLKSHWSFHQCGYEKRSQTCAELDHFSVCQLPRHDLRNGRLNQTAYSLYLFIRDVADGDLVGWIDKKLRQETKRAENDRLSRMRKSLIGPLRHIYGVSDKVLSMALSDLLVAAPRTKRHWFETGVSMIVIDSLVHNFLHRTGMLRQFKAQHTYGPACYRLGGCADIIERVAAQIDARQLNAKYPRTFPRFVQHAIWQFCAQEDLDICNGNQIDDSKRCADRGCPLFHLCDRVTLQKLKSAPR